jgi:UDP-N-acetylglucosamine 1-carboxyvinyltransferase
MARFIIEGGRQLKGELLPQGAKNEALQIICATLLTDRPVIVSNIPEIQDVLKLIEILEDLGVKITHPRSGIYSFQSDQINIDYLSTPGFFKKASSLRGSIMILGPLLARFGTGCIPQPGGDKIGRRRLDTHFRGFEALGAEFEFDELTSCYKIKARKLTGCYMLLMKLP